MSSFTLAPPDPSGDVGLSPPSLGLLDAHPAPLTILSTPEALAIMENARNTSAEADFSEAFEKLHRHAGRFSPVNADNLEALTAALDQLRAALVDQE